MFPTRQYSQFKVESGEREARCTLVSAVTRGSGSSWQKACTSSRAAGGDCGDSGDCGDGGQLTAGEASMKGLITGGEFPVQRMSVDGRTAALSCLIAPATSFVMGTH